MYTAVKASVLHFSGHTWLIYHLRCQTDFNFHIGSEWKPVSGVASGSKHVVNLSFLTSAMLYICYWDSPGKNTGVGCHFLLQCMKVKRESKVAQSCLTLSDPWTAAYQAPLSMGFSRQEYWSGVSLPSPKTNLGFSNIRYLLLQWLLTVD